MKRCLAVFACLTAVPIIAIGCGSDTPAPTIDTFFPADGQISGWHFTTEGKYFNVKAGVSTATTTTGGTALINGDLPPFENTFKTMAIAVYKNDKYKCEVRVFEENDVTTAKTTFAKLPTSSDHYRQDNWTWVSYTLGDEARIGNSGGEWQIDARKGPYYFEAKLSYSESTDATGKESAEAFAKAIAAKLP